MYLIINIYIEETFLNIIKFEIYLYLYSFRDILYFIGYNQIDVPILIDKEYL